MAASVWSGYLTFGLISMPVMVLVVSGAFVLFLAASAARLRKVGSA